MDGGHHGVAIGGQVLERLHHLSSAQRGAAKHACMHGQPAGPAGNPLCLPCPALPCPAPPQPLPSLCQPPPASRRPCCPHADLLGLERVQPRGGLVQEEEGGGGDELAGNGQPLLLAACKAAAAGDAGGWLRSAGQSRTPPSLRRAFVAQTLEGSSQQSGRGRGLQGTAPRTLCAHQPARRRPAPPAAPAGRPAAPAPHPRGRASWRRPRWCLPPWPGPGA